MMHTMRSSLIMVTIHTGRIDHDRTHLTWFMRLGGEGASSGISEAAEPKPYLPYCQIWLYDTSVRLLRLLGALNHGAIRGRQGISPGRRHQKLIPTLFFGGLESGNNTRVPRDIIPCHICGPWRLHVNNILAYGNFGPVERIWFLIHKLEIEFRPQFYMPLSYDQWYACFYSFR